MRRVDVETRASNNAVDTVNAAANAIASAESRLAPITSKKRRWGGFWSISCCFGSENHSKRIGHAVFLPEATAEAAPARSFGPPPPIAVPFAAPPSSPASFRPSEPPSTAQSPSGLLSLTSISPNSYSPGGPRSIFTVGPYAYETHLVSPPIFSTFNTEPSTAPYTPPPESVFLTTPSSPEVPFAQLQRFTPPSSSSHYEFQMYQFYPRSPAAQLISPGSAISGSGTSSPFPDHEYYVGGPHYRDIWRAPLPYHEWGSHQGSGSLTPPDAAIQPKTHDNYVLGRQDSTISPLPCLPDGHKYHEAVVDQRVSFELSVEDVVRCVEKGGPNPLPKALQIASSEGLGGYVDTSILADKTIDKTPSEDVTRRISLAVDAEEGQQSQKQRSVSLGSIKEFNFDNLNREDSGKVCMGSDWLSSIRS